jgi:hypothetical protein
MGNPAEGQLPLDAAAMGLLEPAHACAGVPNGSSAALLSLAAGLPARALLLTHCAAALPLLLLGPMRLRPCSCCRKGSFSSCCMGLPLAAGRVHCPALAVALAIFPAGLALRTAAKGLVLAGRAAGTAAARLVLAVV